MSLGRDKRPEGVLPITNIGIVYARFAETYESVGSLGHFRGQFYELAQKVGFKLELVQGERPLVVLNQPITGRYVGGKKSKFTIHRCALFTNTSKMPGPSFAIPAGPRRFGGACPAAALGEDRDTSLKQLRERLLVITQRQKLPTVTIEKNLPLSTLSGSRLRDADSDEVAARATHKEFVGDSEFICRECYALKGNYNYPSKQINDMVHLAWCEYEMSLGGAERLGQGLAMAIQHVNRTRKEGFQPYFRIHDAGDFYSEEYLEAWVACASVMQHMRFWAPTRQWIMPGWKEKLVAAERRVRAAGGWLVIRPSALRFEAQPPMIQGLAAGSGSDVHLHDACVWRCPVYNKTIPERPPTSTETARIAAIDDLMTRADTAKEKKQLKDERQKIIAGYSEREAVSCLEAECTACWDQPEMPVSYGRH